MLATQKRGNITWRGTDAIRGACGGRSHRGSRPAADRGGAGRRGRRRRDRDDPRGRRRLDPRRLHRDGARAAGAARGARAAPRRAERALVRLDPRAERRPRRSRSGCPPVRPAAARGLARERGAASQRRVDLGVRRADRPRAGDAPPARPRDLGSDGCLRAHDGAGGGERRPLRRARARPRRGRVPVRAGAVRAAAARRGDRARRQPAVDVSAHGRRRGRGAGDGAHGRLPGELSPARELLAELARLFGIPQAAHGYTEAAEREDAIVLPRAG